MTLDELFPTGRELLDRMERHRRGVKAFKWQHFATGLTADEMAAAWRLFAGDRLATVECVWKDGLFHMQATLP